LGLFVRNNILYISTGKVSKLKNKTNLKNNKLEALWSKDYIIIILASCGISITAQFFLPTLPIYAQKIGNTAAYAGFMTGAYTLAALAIRPISGITIDKIGRTKFLVLGAFLCCIVCLFYNLAGTITFLILLRMLNGIAFGIHSTAAGAVAADIIPKSRLMEGMGYFGLYGTIAFATAPSIALSIIGDGQIEKFRTLFILGMAVSFVSMILDLCITYERKKTSISTYRNIGKHKSPDKTNHTRNNNIETCKLQKTFLGFEYTTFIPALVVILVFLGQSSIMSFLPLYANEKKIGNIGLFFTFFAAGMFFSRLLMGKIGDKHGPNIIIIPAITALSFFYLSIPFIHSLKLLLLIAFPFGISLGGVSPVMNAVIIRRCSPSRKGSASAVYFSAVDLGIGAGSILFGFIIVASGYPSMFFLSFVFTLSALFIYVFLLAKKEIVYA
jgi:MFS family permease